MTLCALENCKMQSFGSLWQETGVYNILLVHLLDNFYILVYCLCFALHMRAALDDIPSLHFQAFS